MNSLFRRVALLLILPLSLVGLRAQSYPTPFIVTTLAGQASATYVNGTGTAARFNLPYAITRDSSGNLYLADTSNCVVRKITSAGVVTTLAGRPGSSGYFDSTGTDAVFNTAWGIAADSSGNVFLADTYNQVIRKITAAGVVTTFAGTQGSAGVVNGTGSAARFNYPLGIAVDGSGNVYVSDTVGHTIRKITPAAVVTTLAGSAGVFGSADGTGTAARFYQPRGLAVDSAGNVFVCDGNNYTIRKITAAGVVTTLAGSAGNAGTADGTGSAARFISLFGLAIDSAGKLWVGDYTRIRQVTSAGVTTTLAGTAYSPGFADGTGTAAQFKFVSGVALDPTGPTAYVSDRDGSTIRKVTAAGVVTTFAGSATNNGASDGVGATAKFDQPQAVAMDAAGNTFVADFNNNSIRKVTPAGVVTTFIPNGTALTAPTGLAFDSSGNLFAASQANAIFKITSAGVVSAFAGNGTAGSLDGAGTAARFNSPQGLAVDSAGNVFVADQNNHTIRKITAAGSVSTLAGSAGVSGAVNATGSAARFNTPTGVGVDASGNVFVADNGNHLIRKIAAGGVVTTFAGQVGVMGSADGTGTAAQFNNPWGIAVDRLGYVYVAGNVSNTVRRISPAAGVTTIAGYPGLTGAIDGWGSSAWFNQPQGVAVDVNGRVAIADTTNNLIRLAVAPSTAAFALSASNVHAGTPITFNASDSSAYRSGQTIVSYTWNYGDGSAVGSGVTSGHSYAVAGSYTITLTIVDSDGLIKTAANTVTVTGSNPLDFNGDGKSEIIWQNTVTGDRGFWLMNGTTYAGWVDVGVISTDLRIVGTADFNSDGQSDILWENTVTGKRVIWLMNGTTFVSAVNLGIVSTDWHIAATGDFNGDGKPDILWENTVTGDRGFWLMDGTVYSGWVDIGIISTDLRIVGAADFNGDGQPDIVWENTATGKRVIWLMSGTGFVSSVNLGFVSTDWHIAAVADYDGDHQPDILWENTGTGERYLWLMNGRVFGSGLSLGVVSTDWRIAN